MICDTIIHVQSGKNGKKIPGSEFRNMISSWDALCCPSPGIPHNSVINNSIIICTVDYDRTYTHVCIY